MAKTKRLKTIKAGRLVFAVCYTQPLSSDGKKAREAKTKCSSAARQALNFRAAWQKLRLLLCCNFNAGDFWVTLSYPDDFLPKNRKAAKIIVQKYIDRLRECRKGQGDILKYVYNTEELGEDGKPGRLHHHLIINSGLIKNDFEMLNALWCFGTANVEIRQLGEHELYSDDFLELAQYMCKERNPEAKTYNVGDKCWCSSRNLKRPEETSELVEDNVTVTAPPGAMILDRDNKCNEFGQFDYIVYLLPERRELERRRRRKIE